MKYLLLISVLFFCSCSSEPIPQEGIPENNEAITPLADPNDKGSKDHQEFYPNGGLKMEGNIKDGQRHGLWTSYNTKGSVKSRSEYVNGVLQGPSIVYHDNGVVFYSGSYVDGKQAGVWRFLDNTGEEIKTIDFDSEQSGS